MIKLEIQYGDNTTQKEIVCTEFSILESGSVKYRDIKNDLVLLPAGYKGLKLTYYKEA